MFKKIMIILKIYDILKRKYYHMHTKLGMLKISVFEQTITKKFLITIILKAK